MEKLGQTGRNFHLELGKRSLFSPRASRNLKARQLRHESARRFSFSLFPCRHLICAAVQVIPRSPYNERLGLAKRQGHTV